METDFLNHNKWTRIASPAKSTRQTGKSDWLRHAANFCGRIIFLLIFLISNAYADPPTADPQTVNTNEDNAVTITLTGSDPVGHPLTFEIVSGSSNGSLGPLNRVMANASGAAGNQHRPALDRSISKHATVRRHCRDTEAGADVKTCVVR